MNGYLKQSTASQSRLIGPFVDDTDFKTAETGLTIANTDIKLRANGTTLSNKNSGGGTHQVNGMYSLTWDATDTANVGELAFSVVVSGALQVFGSYVVLEEAVYDALFGASAPGYLQPATAGRQLVVDAAGLADANVVKVGPTGSGTAQTAGDIIGDTNDIQNRLPAALVGGRMDSNVGAISGDSTAADNEEAFFDGTGYAGTNNVIPTVTSVTNPVTAGTVSDKTGYRLSATGVDDIHDEVVDGSLTARQSLRLANAANAGKVSGAATTTVVIRDPDDSKDRVTSTVDPAGNRTAVTLDVS